MDDDVDDDEEMMCNESNLGLIESIKSATPLLSLLGVVNCCVVRRVLSIQPRVQ